FSYAQLTPTTLSTLSLHDALPIYRSFPPSPPRDAPPPHPEQRHARRYRTPPQRAAATPTQGSPRAHPTHVRRPPTSPSARNDHRCPLRPSWDSPPSVTPRGTYYRMCVQDVPQIGRASCREGVESSVVG